MWARPGHIRISGSRQTGSVNPPYNPDNTVDIFGFFENQLSGGTWMTFDQTIEGIHVQSICTNFNGTWAHGSYIKVNGTVIASDHSLSPDGTDNRVDSLNRGTTSSAHDTTGAGNQYGVGYWMIRGHTVVILDNHGSIQSITGYDTWQTPTLADNMAVDLRAVPHNYVVAIGTYDATSVTQNLRDALTNYFGDTAYTNTWNQQRTSQMFLGRRNSTA